MINPPKHSYEEVRGIAVDILLARPSGQFNDFLEGIGQTLLKKYGGWPPPPQLTGIAYPGVGALLHPEDAPLILEVFWDFFRQGAITLGHDANRPNWPWYRLTRFGHKIAHHTPFRFHDTEAYVTLVKSYVPDVSPEAVAYLEEAVAAFYADCLFASCVMLGVAAEAEFLRLLDVASASANYGAKFAPVSKPLFIGQKITKFLATLKPLVPALPRDATEDLDTNFLMIQSVLRIARNQAGHPTAGAPQREQVYVNLQLFAPFARQLMRLRAALI
jgi:hypothetical protein